MFVQKNQSHLDNKFVKIMDTNQISGFYFIMDLLIKKIKLIQYIFIYNYNQMIFIYKQKKNIWMYKVQI